MQASSFNNSLKSQTAMLVWLCFVCLLVFAMVVLGGAVRLTGSGLSMVEWKPILGVLPPLNATDWQIAFDKYRAFPEYQIINKGMSLSDFKFIYYMEYLHRLLARFMGLVFLFGVIYFALKGCLTKPLRKHLLILFCLGGMQALMGWIMVKSGLVDNPHVSAVRLTAHLLLAFVIYVYFIRIISAMSLPFIDLGGKTKRLSHIAFIVVFIMIASGGLVAGTKAGFIYNTFPTMHGQWWPKGMFNLSPWGLNLIENPVTIQWIHRFWALVVFVVCLSLVFQLWFRVKQHLLAFILFFALVLQILIGISTLVSQVPLYLGVLHQAGALILIGVLAVVVFRQHPISLQ